MRVAFKSLIASVAGVVFCGVLVPAVPASAEEASPSVSYAQLVALFEEWRVLERPESRRCGVLR